MQQMLVSPSLGCLGVVNLENRFYSCNPFMFSTMTLFSDSSDVRCLHGVHLPASVSKCFSNNNGVGVLISPRQGNGINSWQIKELEPKKIQKVSYISKIKTYQMEEPYVVCPDVWLLQRRAMDNSCWKSCQTCGLMISVPNEIRPRKPGNRPKEVLQDFA